MPPGPTGSLFPRAPRPDAFCSRRPSQKHNAHSPETVRIHYPFHPLYGQILKVRRRAKFPRGEYIYCELPDGTIGGFPAWIAEASSTTEFAVGLPLTSAVALSELRALLDSLRSDLQRANQSLTGVLLEGTNDTDKKTIGNGEPDEPAVLHDQADDITGRQTTRTGSRSRRSVVKRGRGTSQSR